jgi:hypothetical protein
LSGSARDPACSALLSRTQLCFRWVHSEQACRTLVVAFLLVTDTQVHPSACVWGTVCVAQT